MCAAVLTYTLSCSSRLSPSDTLPRRRSSSSSSFLLTLCLSSHHRQTLHKHFTFLGSRGCFIFSPFPFSPRGYCLPLSAILSAACDQTGEPQCASEGPAEGGSQTPFNHVMPRFCQLVGCQTKILAVYEVAARVSCPLRLPPTHRTSSS